MRSLPSPGCHNRDLEQSEGLCSIRSDFYPTCSDFHVDGRNDTGFKIINTPSDDEIALSDQSRNDRGGFGEKAGLILDIVFHGEIYVAACGSDCRTNMLKQTADLSGDFISLHRGPYRAALGMSKYIQDPSAQNLCSKFETAYVFAGSHIAGNSCDEEITESLVKDNLNGWI